MACVALAAWPVAGMAGHRRAELDTRQLSAMLDQVEQQLEKGWSPQPGREVDASLQQAASPPRRSSKRRSPLLAALERRRANNLQLPFCKEPAQSSEGEKALFEAEKLRFSAVAPVSDVKPSYNSMFEALLYRLEAAQYQEAEHLSPKFSYYAEPAPVKGVPRMVSKITGKYSASKKHGCEDVTDLVRGSLVFKTPSGIHNFLQRLNGTFMGWAPCTVDAEQTECAGGDLPLGLGKIQIAGMKNRMHLTWTPCTEAVCDDDANSHNCPAGCEDVGYRDVLVNVRMYRDATGCDSGAPTCDFHVAELQLHLETMLLVKQGKQADYFGTVKKLPGASGHLLYRVIRMQAETVALGTTGWEALQPVAEIEGKVSRAQLEAALPTKLVDAIATGGIGFCEHPKDETTTDEGRSQCTTQKPCRVDPDVPCYTRFEAVVSPELFPALQQLTAPLTKAQMQEQGVVYAAGVFPFEVYTRHAGSDVEVLMHAQDWKERDGFYSGYWEITDEAAACLDDQASLNVNGLLAFLKDGNRAGGWVDAKPFVPAFTPDGMTQECAAELQRYAGTPIRYTKHESLHGYLLNGGMPKSRAQVELARLYSRRIYEAAWEEVQMFDLSGAIEMDEVSPSKYIAAASLPAEAVYAYAPTACRAHDGKGKKGECCDAGCQYFELSRKGEGAGMCVEAAGRESEYFSTPVDRGGHGFMGTCEELWFSISTTSENKRCGDVHDDAIVADLQTALGVAPGSVEFASACGDDASTPLELDKLDVAGAEVGKGANVGDVVVRVGEAEARVLKAKEDWKAGATKQIGGLDMMVLDRAVVVMDQREAEAVEKMLPYMKLRQEASPSIALRVLMWRINALPYDTSREATLNGLTTLDVRLDLVMCTGMHDVCMTGETHSSKEFDKLSAALWTKVWTDEMWAKFKETLLKLIENWAKRPGFHMLPSEFTMAKIDKDIILPKPSTPAK